MSFLITKDDTKLYYKDWGTGKPVLLLHAWAMSSAFWEYTMLYLNSCGFRCIAYDRRGHGRSDDPGKGYDFITLSNDLHDIIESLELMDVTIVGHSMGGCEAIYYQNKFGNLNRLSKMVLIGTPDCLLQSDNNPNGFSINDVEQFLGILSANFPDWLNANAEPFYLAKSFGVSDEIIRWTINMMLQTSMKAVIDCQRQVFYSDKRNELRKINIPTMIIHGDTDASIPFRCAEEIAQAIPNSVLRTYTGAPHGIIITHAQQLYNDLTAFINGNVMD